MEKLRKKGFALLKLGISAALLYFIFTKIPFSKVIGIVKESEPLYLVAAILLFVISKFLAAQRLNLYFHQIGVGLTSLSNLKLYLLGMFYNLFLPGGIGGDAYKGYYIKQHFKVATKKVVAVLLLDRLSGLLLLFIFACFLGIGLNVPALLPYQWIFGICIPLSVAVFWGLQKRYFSYIMPVFWSSTGYSALLQLAQLGSAFMILYALQIEYARIEYLFIFLISSIVAVLPLTIGGIGSRELVFLYGALWLGLEEDRSIGVSMLFFMITALISLLGVWYHFKKPSLKLKQ